MPGTASRGRVYITLDDVDSFQAEIRGRGMIAPEAPEDTPWRREMLVVDPDGNRLRFANQKTD